MKTYQSLLVSFRQLKLYPWLLVREKNIKDRHPLHSQCSSESGKSYIFSSSPYSYIPYPYRRHRHPIIVDLCIYENLWCNVAHGMKEHIIKMHNLLLKCFRNESFLRALPFIFSRGCYYFTSYLSPRYT